MHTLNLAIIGITVFSGLVAALPTSHGHTNDTGLLFRRRACPTLTQLPIHWDSKNDEAGIEVLLDDSYGVASLIACTYTVIGGWGGTPARVIVPMPGMDESGKSLYKTAVEISTRLGKVLQVAKTNLDTEGLPVIVTTVPGKVIEKTEFWQKYFGRDRKAPSPEAYDSCVTMIEGVYDKVFEAYIRHVKNGLLGEVTTPHIFARSIRWSDNLDECAIENWNPETVSFIRPGGGIDSYMENLTRQKIRNQDLRIEEGTYTFYLTHGRPEYKRVRGWCEYFRTSAKPLNFSYE